jgi:hypothetical protein
VKPVRRLDVAAWELRRLFHDTSTLVNACSILGSVPTTLTPTDDLAACCSPITAGALDQPAAERLAAVLKVLAEPSRPGYDCSPWSPHARRAKPASAT